MEFIVVTEHESINSVDNQLKDMQFITLPEALLVYTDCKDADEFAQSIVHITFTFDYKPVLQQQKFCSVPGVFLFRHPRSAKTSLMTFQCDKILVETKMICVRKINNIVWLNDDGACTFWGILEAKLRLQLIQYTETTRNEMRYYAIPVASCCVPDTVKPQLNFLKCEFSINTAFASIEDGRKTQKICRCTLFPVSLLCVVPILNARVFSIVTLQPDAMYLCGSDNHLQIFGIDHGISQSKHFLTCIRDYHTASEMERLSTCILPQVMSLQSNSSCMHPIEYVTPRGKEHYTTTFINVRNSCLVIRYEKSSEYVHT